MFRYTKLLALVFSIAAPNALSFSLRHCSIRWAVIPSENEAYAAEDPSKWPKTPLYISSPDVFGIKTKHWQSMTIGIGTMEDDLPPFVLIHDAKCSPWTELEVASDDPYRVEKVTHGRLHMYVDRDTSDNYHRCHDTARLLLHLTRADNVCVQPFRRSFSGKPSYDLCELLRRHLYLKFDHSETGPSNEDDEAKVVRIHNRILNELSLNQEIPLVVGKLVVTASMKDKLRFTVADSAYRQTLKSDDVHQCIELFFKAGAMNRLPIVFEETTDGTLHLKGAVFQELCAATVVRQLRTYDNKSTNFGLSTKIVDVLTATLRGKTLYTWPQIFLAFIAHTGLWTPDELSTIDTSFQGCMSKMKDVEKLEHVAAHMAVDTKTICENITRLPQSTPESIHRIGTGSSTSTYRYSPAGIRYSTSNFFPGVRITTSFGSSVGSSAYPDSDEGTSFSVHSRSTSPARSTKGGSAKRGSPKGGSAKRGSTKGGSAKKRSSTRARSPRFYVTPDGLTVSHTVTLEDSD